MAHDTLELTALDRALLRAAQYRFLADAFLAPAPGSLRRLRSSLPSPGAAAGWPAAAATDLATALAGVRGLLAEATEDSLGADFRATFGHTVPESYPPLEARFGSAHPFQEAQDLGDIAAFYGAFGLRVRPGIGERVDHIALELEFLYLLAVKEAYARERGREAEAERCLAASRGFFGDHLGRWGGAFAALVARKAPAALLRGLGGLLAATVRADAGALGVSPRPVSPEPIPLPPEPSPEELVATDGPMAGPRGLCG